MMNEKRLQEIEGRLAKATKGPWQQALDVDEPKIVVASARPNFSLLGIRTRDDMAIFNKVDDAELCACAPQDLADLVAEVRSLRAAAEVQRLWMRANGLSEAPAEVTG